MEILVIISGGSLREVYADRPATVTLLDYDNVFNPAEEAALDATLQSAKDRGIIPATINPKS